MSWVSTHDRKNWLFAGHTNGARAVGTLYGLIETAKACGLEPYHYLRHILEKIPYARTVDDYKAPLPQKRTAIQLARPIPWVLNPLLVVHHAMLLHRVEDAVCPTLAKIEHSRS